MLVVTQDRASCAIRKLFVVLLQLSLRQRGITFFGYDSRSQDFSVTLGPDMANSISHASALHRLYLTRSAVRCTVPTNVITAAQSKFCGSK
jgi:hypothetical protein